MEQSFWFLGSHATVLADCQTTKGNYDLVECTSLPGLACPWARHTAYEVQILVLEGKLTIATETGTLVLPAGQRGVIPKGVSHSKTTSGLEAARYLVLASPSGFAQFIRTMGILAEVGSLPPTVKPNPLILSRAAAEVGDELLTVPSIANEFDEKLLLKTVNYCDRLTTDCLKEVMHDLAVY